MKAQKKLNSEEAEKIFAEVINCNEYEEYFVGVLKHAKAKDFADDVLTLKFDRQPIAAYFVNCYRKRFEETASNIVGRKITLEIESEE